MKIKNLQINVLTLLFGFAAFCFVNKIEANNATKSPEGQPFFDQNGDDVSTQKPAKRVATVGWDFRGPINASGKTTSVVSDPSDHNIVYAGAAHNGVWKSTDGGSKDWNKIPVENNKNLSVTCLALDGNVLYAGTGGDFIGQGVYKAEGDGALKLMPGTENWTHVSKVAVAGGKVYAATSQGLMCYSGGAWKVCTATKEGNTVNLDDPIRDMSVNNGGLVIAIMNQVECYISKTGDSGEFEYKEYLKTVFTSASPYLLPDNMSVTTSPVDNNVLYVVAVHPDDKKDNDGKVYKAFISEDQGKNWTIILSWFSGDDFIDPLEGNGININNIYADPIDPYTLYIASLNIWKGTRHGNSFDFGLSAISISGFPANSYDAMSAASDPFYLHSNVRSIDFVSSYGDFSRLAYVATDGGIYRAEIYISPYLHYTRPFPAHLNLLIGSYNHVSANNGSRNNGREEILMGTPTLGVQAIDSMTNNEVSARYVWDLGIGENRRISEGFGGACAISAINEKFYIYSLLLNNALVFRRSVDRGVSFQPMRTSHNVAGVEWFDEKMLPANSTPAPKYDAPIAMWENFNDNNTFDTVWFKADTTANFFKGDKTIYAPSKNFDYPIEHPISFELAHGDSIQVPDPVQNRFFVGLQHKVFMTRDALIYGKTNVADAPPVGLGKMNWFQVATLDAKDTTTVFALSDDANTLYVGTKMGRIHCLTNLKEVHDSISNESVQKYLSYEFSGKEVCAMAVDPTDANHVVVVLKGGGDNVYETFNGLSESATFNLVKGNLPNNVYAVLFPKGAKKGTVMVGTERGIWMKESGSEWTASNTGIGEVPVMTLTQLTTFRPGVKNVPYLDADGKMSRMNYPNNTKSYLTIYAGTYGSGIFSSRAYVGIEEFPDSPAKESNALVVVPNPVIDAATIDLDMTKGNATIQVFNVEGRLIKEQTAKTNANTINFKDYAPGTYIIQVIQGGAIKSGKVIKQ